MPLPTRTVTGTYYEGSGKTVRFTLLNTVRDLAADETALALIYEEVTLDIEGSFSVDLLCQDPALDAEPIYLVKPGIGSQTAFQISVPAGAGSIDITDLAPAGTPLTPSQITELLNALAAEVTAREDADSALIPLAQKGAPDGVATLDGSGTIPDPQIPATITRDSELATALAALVDSSPAIRDTLGEINAALSADESAAAALTTLVAGKAPIASPVFTGNPTAPTPAPGDNDASLATTAYVQNEIGLLVPKALVDAKGDLLAGTADNAVGRLAVGSDGQELVADSTQATGLAWKNRTRSVVDNHALVSVVNTIAQTSLGTLAIPTSVAAGDVVRVVFIGELTNNTGANATFSFILFLGATQLFGSNNSSQASSASARRWRFEVEMLVVNPASDQRVNAFAVIGAPGSFSFITNAASVTGRTSSIEDLTAGKSFDLQVLMGTADPNSSVNFRESYMEVTKR